MSSTRETRTRLAAVPASTSYYQRAMPWLLIVLGAIFGYALISVLPHEAADEGFHAPQVWRFFNGEYRLDPAITVFPSYHYVMAWGLKMIGLYSIDLMRFFTAAVALLATPVFYRLVARHSPDEAPIRTVQFFFLPLLFPFYFLIYTDTWALLAVLLCVILALDRRYVLSALAGVVSVLLRQTEIVWVGFAFLLACWPEQARGWRAWGLQFLRAAWPRAWPYLLVFAGFAVFLWINRGVALGSRSDHPIDLNISNLYFFLLCAWVLFLPYHIHQWPRIAALLRRPRVWAVLVFGLFVYLGTFDNDHGMNNIPFYLRNRVLMLMADSLAWRTVLYLPMAWTALSLVTTRLPEKRFHALWPVAALSACLHPLIEQRYYLPVLVLLCAWRPACRGEAEVGTAVIYAAAARRC